MRGWIWRAAAAVCSILVLASPRSAAAQQAAGLTRNWASVFVGFYPGVGEFDSPVGPESGTQEQHWSFGSGLGAGASLARVLSPSIRVGVEGSVAPSVGVDVTDTLGTTTSGHASVSELMATARITTGGGAGLGFYLSGGAGAVLWGMPAPASSATDFAARTAAGLEYQGSPRRAFFLSWGQFWAFHKHHGAASNTVKYSQIRGGVRFGW